MPERYLGRTLGRFRIDSIVGSGGFAWVYKGYDPELDIPVAIKVLKPQYAGEETFETRFRREASTAAKLRHPNIIRILAVGREESAVFFVMDYLPTGLDDRLRIMGTLPETLLARLGMDVSAALAFAHREGVIHRDIKTDNILFDEHGNAVVADFGIARAVSGYMDQTGTNMVVGTPQYFSPEQARGLPLDGRADIYSLGVTLFKAATGVLPFQGDDWYDIARQHVEEPPPKPRAFNPALSRDIERVILKCLAKNPEDRYPTGDALHTELVQLFGKASTPDGDATVLLPTPATGARPLVAAVPRWRRVPRSTLVAAGFAAIAALAMVMGALHARDDGLAAPTPTVVHAQPPAPPPSAPPPASAAPPVAVMTPAPAPAVPLTHELRVIAPAGARILLDGVAVGAGEWRSMTVRPGDHRVSAIVKTVDDCPSARQDVRARVERSGTTDVRLAPRPCGYLALDAEPRGGRYVVRSAAGADVASGALPHDAPLILPTGDYTLQVSAKFCADYRGAFTVTPGETHRERVRLICR